MAKKKGGAGDGIKAAKKPKRKPKRGPRGAFLPGNRGSWRPHGDNAKNPKIHQAVVEGLLAGKHRNKP